MQLGGSRKLFDQATKHVERHERRPVFRPISTQPHGTHLAAQIALTNRLNLDEMGQLHAMSRPRGSENRAARQGMHHDGLHAMQVAFRA